MVTMIVLSLIQGLTEFLPVSSSGHLILFPTLLGWGDHSLEIDGMVHFGTLLAVVGYFFHDIRRMIVGFFVCAYHRIAKTYTQPFADKHTHAHYAKLGLSLVVATLPVIVAGVALKRLGIEHVRTPHIIAYASILGGIALYAADLYQSRRNDQYAEGEGGTPTFAQAFIIGLCQCISLIPGSSRSGMCMLGARMLGFSRVDSARFAFLMSVPAILGACTLILCDGLRDGLQTHVMDLVGYGALSFLFGSAAIHIMLRFIKNHSFLIFMIYRVGLGVMILYYT